MNNIPFKADEDEIRTAYKFLLYLIEQHGSIAEQYLD